MTKKKAACQSLTSRKNIAIFQMKSCWLHLAQLFCRKQQKPPAGSPGGGLLLWQFMGKQRVDIN
ncbi:hypothetical protein K6755_10055 [Faecalibacterium prausnitzii]